MVSGPLRLQGAGLLAFPMAVLAAAWLGGMGPGILSAIGTALAIAVFFAKPVGSLAVEAPMERIALVAFVMASVIESTVVGASRRSERGIRRLNEAFSTWEAKYRLLFDRNPEPLLIFDTRTRGIFAANRAALAAYGYSAEEIQGMRIDALLEPESAEGFFADEEGRANESRRSRTKSGEVLEVEIRCTPAHWVGGRACLMVVRDVTARHRAEKALLATNEELRRARDAAEQATKARDRFLVVLSHELRTPLTAALLASTALEKRPNVPDEVRRWMTLIRAKVEFEAKLIDDLLDVVRMFNGNFVVTRAPANATETVARAIGGSLADARNKRIHIAREFSVRTGIVAIDPERLRQAVTSLIANAMDAAPSGSTVGVWMRDEPTGQVAIGVRHEGSSGEVARMFDPFERGGTPGAPKAWALGLGLAISKGIAEACGGSIEAGFDGESSSIVMRLPMAY
jgi:PAS domain S-box-containing protein